MTNSTTKTFSRVCMSGTERANWLEHHRKDYSGRIIVAVVIVACIVAALV